MFRNRPASLRMFSADAGFSGEANSPSEGGGSVNALGGNTPEPAAAENPSWQSHLDKFPNDPNIRHIAKGVFSEWDKEVQGRFNSLNEKYKPYQSFVDKGVDPKRLESAYGVAEMVESNPEEFTRLLAQQLNIPLAEAQAAVEEMQEEESEDPRLTQLQQQQQQFAGWIQQQEQERSVAQQEQQMVSEFAQIEKTYGSMTPEIKNEVLREALRLSYEKNTTVSMTEAYQSLERLISSVRQVPRPGQTAPRTMPSGGAMPLSDPPKHPGKMTSSETKARAAEVALRYMAQPQ